MRQWLPILLLILLVPSGLVGQAPDRSFSQASDSKAITYVIALTDRLRINIFQEDDLGVISRVDSKGRINLQLVGPILVAGMTIEDAELTVETAYRDHRYLRDPQVTIVVEEYAAREVIVQGEVVQPGRIPLPIESGMTVLDAITKAGGFTQTAKGDSVTVTRGMPDGSTQKTVIDVKSVLRGRKGARETDSSMLLLPDDIVYVPMRIM